MNIFKLFYEENYECSYMEGKILRRMLKKIEIMLKIGLSIELVKKYLKIHIKKDKNKDGREKFIMNKFIKK